MPISDSLRLFVATTALGLATAATAAPVVDQSYDPSYVQTAGSIGVFGGSRWFQTFTAGVDTLDWAAAGLLGLVGLDAAGQIGRFPLALAKIWGASSIDAAGVITMGAAPLGVSATSAIAAGYIETGLNPPDQVPMTGFSFAAPISLVVGQSYLLEIALEFTSDSLYGNASWRYGQINYPSNSPSAGYAGGGSGYLDRDGKVYVEPGEDFAFATGRNTTNGDGNTQRVPEPQTAALVLLALALAVAGRLGGVRRPPAA